MNMTKRDVADIVLVWMAMGFILTLLNSIVTLGTWIGMTGEAGRFTDKFIAVKFQIIHIIILLFLNYILLFKRSLLLLLVVPDGKEKNVSIPSGLTVLTLYAFWIRLFGIFTFLSSGIRFLGDLVLDVAARRDFAVSSFWIGIGKNGLIYLLLAVIVIWNADWIAEKLGKTGATKQAAEADSSEHQDGHWQEKQ